METKTRQIALCLNDDGELIGIEARREVVYEDGMRRVLPAEPATADDFVDVITGEHKDLAASLSATLAQLDAAAKINTALDGELSNMRSQLEQSEAQCKAQAEMIGQLETTVRDAEKRVEDTSRAARLAMAQQAEEFAKRAATKEE